MLSIRYIKYITVSIYSKGESEENKKLRIHRM